MRRPIFSTICFLVLTFLGLFLYLRYRQYDVVITQSQIDDALKVRFPMSETYLLMFRVTFSHPKVRLLPDTNRIEIDLDAELNNKLASQQTNLGGTAVVVTGITYRDETHQFFLVEPEIKQLVLQGISQEYLDKVAQFASNAARDYLPRLPIYTLEARDLNSSARRLLLKRVEVKGNEIHATLGI
jgi:hypothetical protein